MTRSHTADAIRRFPLLFTFLLALAGCSDPTAERLSAALVDATSQGPGAIAALDTIAPGEWSRIYVFGPYSSSHQIAECLDLESADHLDRGIDRLERVHLLVLEDSTGEYHSFVVPNTNANFGTKASGYGYDRASARFVVREAPSGSWPLLAPVASPTVDCGIR